MRLVLLGVVSIALIWAATLLGLHRMRCDETEVRSIAVFVASTPVVHAATVEI